MFVTKNKLHSSAVGRLLLGVALLAGLLGSAVIVTPVHAAVTGTITVVKDTVPNDAEDFSFIGSDPIGAFSLDDDADVTLPNQQTFTLAAGTYNIKESLVFGWDLTNLVCTTNDNSQPVNTGGGIAQIILDDGENVTCTFTNTKQGTITVNKVANPKSNDNFTINVGGEGEGEFVLDDADPDDGDTFLNSKTLSFAPGNYTLSESIPSGWNLSDLSCETTDTNHPVTVTTNLAAIALVSGENVTCTFTNTQSIGTITVVKDTVPNDAEDFSFIGSDPISAFSLDDDADVTLPNQQTFTLGAGTYNIKESLVFGWDLTNLVCTTNDNSQPVNTGGGIAQIILDDGENVICTFTNTKQGTITVNKVANPKSNDNFTINVGGEGEGEFVLDDASPDDGDTFLNSKTLSFAPGNYTLSESIPSGWNLSDLSCETTDTNHPVTVTTNLAAIALVSGENVTCTFTNAKPTSSITITKLANAAGTFTFSGTGGLGNFSLNNGGSTTFNNLTAGAYTVTEDDPSQAFNLTGLVCNDANGTVNLNTRTASVQLDAGENVTCTFTNTKANPNPKIAVDKQEPVIATGGGPLTYTYKATNPGNVPMSNVTVSDNKCSPVNYGSGDNGNNLLDPGETWTFTCTYTPSFTSSKLTNKATVTGKFGTTTYTATDNATLYPFTLKKKIYLYWAEPQKGFWSFKKDNSVPYLPVDNTSFTVEVYKDSVLVGTYTISQNSPQKLWLSAGTYTFEEVGLPAGYVAVDSSFTYSTSDGHGYHYTYNNHKDKCDDGKNLNEWTFRNVIKSDLAIDKTGPATARKGTTITYNYTVTNSGPASVKPKVTDDKCSYVTYVSGDTDHDGRVGPGEAWTFKCNYKVKGNIGSQITNKATVSDANQPKSSNLGGDIDANNNKDTWTLTVIN